ncbi:MAG TPA: PEP-CTERM sorting domain-containing protein [Candidatus Acidoferrales bacterium]|nr:PEP-CTERM sorting domain-containing protein [Candidatus Acidoferrales bacterium]
MKTSIFGVLCGALAALVLGPTASAGTLIYEPFDYTAGQPISGQTNPSTGTNWNTAGPSGSTVHTVVSPGLTSPSGFPAASGNAADLQTGDTAANLEFDRLDIPGSFDPVTLAPNYYTGSTLYWSALVNVPDLTGLTIANTNANANNDLIIAFNNTQGAQASRPSNWAGELVIRGGQAATPFTTYNLGIRGSSTTAGTTYFSGALNPGQTYLVVGRYTQGPDASIATDDSNSLWINPSSSTYGAAAAPAPDGSSNGSINTGNPTLNYAASLLIGAGISSGSNPNHVTLDEIRVGTTWADVTSVTVPEPATIGILGIGAVVGLLARRRRAA